MRDGRERRATFGLLRFSSSYFLCSVRGLWSLFSRKQAHSSSRLGVPSTSLPWSRLRERASEEMDPDQTCFVALRSLPSLRSISPS